MLGRQSISHDIENVHNIKSYLSNIFFLPHQGIHCSLGISCFLIPLCLWANCYLFPVPLGKILIIFQCLAEVQLSQ